MSIFYCPTHKAIEHVNTCCREAELITATSGEALGWQAAADLKSPANSGLARQTIEGEPVYLDAWPLRDAVRRLVEAADHLFDVHDGDHHGYEELICARDAAKEWLSASHREVAQRTIEGLALEVEMEAVESWQHDEEYIDHPHQSDFMAPRLARDWLKLRALVHSQAAQLEELDRCGRAAIRRYLCVIGMMLLYFIMTTYDIHHEAYLTRQTIRRLAHPETP